MQFTSAVIVNRVAGGFKPPATTHVVGIRAKLRLLSTSTPAKRYA